MSLTPSSFLDIAEIVSRASTCSRASVGAVIVQDRRIVSTGYNGTPPGHPHCEHTSDMGEEDGCYKAVHAEANAIAWAARAGVRVERATMYCTHMPCYKCAQLILACGIREFYFRSSYRLREGIVLLDENLPFVGTA